MELQQIHIDALAEAEARLSHCDFCPYLEMKSLLARGDATSRNQFQRLFRRYYGLNRAGLTEEFLNIFFERLYAWNQESNIQDLLVELYDIQRLQEDHALQLSFVSKLVSIRDETSPIYDKHVKAFFGIAAHLPDGEIDDKITWFIDFMNGIANDYACWVQDPRLTPVLERFKKRDDELPGCQPVRLVDWLVWKVGNEKLL